MDVGYIFNVSSNNPIIMELKRQKNIQSSPGHSEYKSFYKSVGGNEGEKCNYPTRLDLYGKGCYHVPIVTQNPCWTSANYEMRNIRQ